MNNKEKYWLTKVSVDNVLKAADPLQNPDGSRKPGTGTVSAASMVSGARPGSVTHLGRPTYGHNFNDTNRPASSGTPGDLDQMPFETHGQHGAVAGGMAGLVGADQGFKPGDTWRGSPNNRGKGPLGDPDKNPKPWEINRIKADPQQLSKHQTGAIYRPINGAENSNQDLVTNPTGLPPPPKPPAPNTAPGTYSGLGSAPTPTRPAAPPTRPAAPPTRPAAPNTAPGTYRGLSQADVARYR